MLEQKQKKWQRIILLVVLGYEGLGALVGGALLVASPDGRYMDMPVAMMHGTFQDFLIPGVILFGLGLLNVAAFFAVLRRSRQGALATLVPGAGDPYCSLVNVATAPDGAPILLISRLAVHTRNILADPRVSLMLDERGPGDPLEGARIMLAGIAEQAAGEQSGIVRRRYLAAHPSAEAFVDFPDFLFFTLRLRNAHLVAGFGKIVDLPAADFLTQTGGAESLIAAEPDIVTHMNADHLSTMNLYATALLGANPDLKLIMAICSPAVPGAAEAVKQAGKAGAVKVIGLGLPSENRSYVKDGVTQAVILWKVQDLGYLTVQAANALAKGTLKAGDKSIKAGRLGDVAIDGDSIVLGKPFTFTKENIDQFDF